MSQDVYLDDITLLNLARDSASWQLMPELALLKGIKPGQCQTCGGGKVAERLHGVRRAFLQAPPANLEGLRQLLRGGTIHIFLAGPDGQPVEHVL